MNRTDIYATLISLPSTHWTHLTHLISLNPSHSPLFLHLLLPSQMSFSSLFLFLSWICVLLNCLHVGLSGPIIFSVNEIWWGSGKTIVSSSIMSFVEFLLESPGCFIGSSKVMSPSGYVLWGLASCDSPSPDIVVASWHREGFFISNATIRGFNYQTYIVF